jgi:hypothetical protein
MNNILNIINEEISNLPDLSQTRIVDDLGNPLIVYRTQKNERNQGVERQSDMRGIYFSANRDSTKIYGDITKEYYLNIKNPLILKDKDWYLSLMPVWVYNDIISKGYDGAVWLRNGIMYEIIAFYENQIIPISNNINEDYNHVNYLKWKRQNVTLRGVRNNVGTANSDDENLLTAFGDVLGKGLYTAFLGNKQMAKQYGKVYFVLNAIPKHPKVFNTLNDWEIWFGNTVVYEVSKQMGKNYPDKRDFFAKTTIEKEMMRRGYDGVVIKGREMVNYTPPDNVLYFSNENELMTYFENNS